VRGVVFSCTGPRKRGKLPRGKWGGLKRGRIWGRGSTRVWLGKTSHICSRGGLPKGPLPQNGIWPKKSFNVRVPGGTPVTGTLHPRLARRVTKKHSGTMECRGEGV